MAIQTVALSLDSLTLSDDEESLVRELITQLQSYQATNIRKEAYYEGTYRAIQIGISIPPQFRDLETVIDWPGTAIDVIGERLEWEGWVTENDDDFGLRDIYLDNQLQLESKKLWLDTLIYGTAFVTVGAGFDGEPNPLITVESPRNMTGIWNPRTRRLSAALAVNACEPGKSSQVTEVTLYLPNQTIFATLVNGRWTATERNQHNRGRVLVAQVFNRPRASKLGGSSEITRAMRGYTDAAARTMMGMEISREFYAFPQRFILGAAEEMFEDADGNPIPGWQTSIANIWAAPDVQHDENDPKSITRPEIGQFPQGSPEPFLAILRTLSQMAAGAAGIPAHEFGFVTDNPTSADAIRAGENRLVKRTEERQAGFGFALNEVAKLSLLVRDGKLPDGVNRVSSKWRDAATPTQAAAADAVVKLVGAGVLPADSDVVLDRINISPQEKAQIKNERRKSTSTQRLADIAAAVQARTDASQTAQDAPVTEE